MSPRISSLLCVAALIVGATEAYADSARQSLSRGLKEYQSGNYEEAQKAFEQAAGGAQDARLDPGPAHYNEGNAFFRLGQPEQAASKFMDALRSTDLSLQSKAFFNRGNALFRLADIAHAEGDMDTALQALEQALAMYENTMALDPGDRDSKINYELTLRKQEELKELQQQQQQQEKEKQDQEQSDQQKQDQQQQQQQQQQQPEEQPDSPDQPDEPESTAEQQQQQEQENNAQQQDSPSEEMTPEEARVLLDAMRQEEQASRERYRMIHGTPAPVDKDW